MFKQAVKHEAKLRLAIAGPSGSGKTYTALAIATNLGDRVAVVDTEHGSASKYADIFAFDVVEMHPPFHPGKYVKAIEAAAEMGYEVIVLDSLSHAWNGPGGLLEIVDDFAKRMKTANTFAAWKDATPIQNALIEGIVGAGLHVIATMRSKQEYVLEQVERNGRMTSQPKKVGMAPVQRDSMEYEFDVYLDMTIENDALIQKTRCSALSGRVFNRPGADVADILKEWLSGEPAPAPESAKPRKAVNAPEVIQPDEVKLTARDDHEMHVSPGGNGHKPESANLTADCRAWLQDKIQDGKTNLGMVIDAVDMTRLFNGRDEILAAIKEFPSWPKSYQHERGQVLKGASALAIYDWLIERAEIEAALEAENKDALGAE